MAQSFQRVTALAFGLLLATAGCRASTGTTTVDPTSDPSLLAEDGADTSAAETDTEVLSTSLVSVASTGPALAAAPGIFFLPEGCLKVSTSGATHTYDFDDCTGPHGLLHIQGSITVTTSPVAPTAATGATPPVGLGLTLMGSSLSVNGSTVDWSARATISIESDGVTRSMVWAATLSGTTVRGRPFTRTNQKTITWKLGGDCYTLAGSSTGTVSDRVVTVDIQSYARCSVACPKAGGDLSIENETTKDKVEITFDGSDEATLVDGTTQSTFPLLCAP